MAASGAMRRVFVCRARVSPDHARTLDRDEGLFARMRRNSGPLADNHMSGRTAAMRTACSRCQCLAGDIHSDISLISRAWPRAVSCKVLSHRTLKTAETAIQSGHQQTA
jgi:hypothetical protein